MRRKPMDETAAGFRPSPRHTTRILMQPLSSALPLSLDSCSIMSVANNAPTRGGDAHSFPANLRSSAESTTKAPTPWTRKKGCDRVQTEPEHRLSWKTLHTTQGSWLELCSLSGCFCQLVRMRRDRGLTMGNFFFCIVHLRPIHRD
jgi:hypothetical protein